jgi:hypothetical protein
MDVGSVSLLEENVRRFVLVGEEDLGLDWRTELSVHKLRGKTTRKRLTDGGDIRRLAELAIPLWRVRKPVNWSDMEKYQSAISYTSTTHWLQPSMTLANVRNPEDQRCISKSLLGKGAHSQELVDGIHLSLGKYDLTVVAALLERLVDGWDVGDAGV